MVIDALKTVGGNKWFRVVERTGIGILFVRDKLLEVQGKTLQKKEGQDKYQELNQLLFAGIIIEGGIVGYDSICLQVVEAQEHLGLE